MATEGQDVRLNRVVGDIPAGTVGIVVKINVNKALVTFPVLDYPSTWVSKDWVDWDITVPFEEQETPEAKRRTIARTIAFNTFLSSWQGHDANDLIVAEHKPDDVEVWQPFENEEWGDVLDHVENLAGEIEGALK